MAFILVAKLFNEILSTSFFRFCVKPSFSMWRSVERLSVLPKFCNGGSVLFFICTSAVKFPPHTCGLLSVGLFLPWFFPYFLYRIFHISWSKLIVYRYQSMDHFREIFLLLAPCDLSWSFFHFSYIGHILISYDLYLFPHLYQVTSCINFRNLYQILQSVSIPEFLYWFPQSLSMAEYKYGIPQPVICINFRFSPTGRGGSFPRTRFFHCTFLLCFLDFFGKLMNIFSFFLPLRLFLISLKCFFWLFFLSLFLVLFLSYLIICSVYLLLIFAERPLLFDFIIWRCFSFCTDITICRHWNSFSIMIAFWFYGHLLSPGKWRIRNVLSFLFREWCDIIKKDDRFTDWKALK